MKRTINTYARSQSGYTLVEVVITCAIGAVLMSALTSVVLTSYRAAAIATSRIEASGQIRNFQFGAYDDFARSGVPSSSCAPPKVCIVLTGTQMSNSTTPTPISYVVTYTWDGVAILDRQVQADLVVLPSRHVATSVTAFSWNVDAPTNTVVVNLTVTVLTYSESQSFRFYPRRN